MENKTESLSAPSKTYAAKFTGEGLELFLILLANVILTFLTLGIYAAWGKVRILQFFYSNTEFSGQPFRFTGTGKELFFGYLKAILIIIGFYTLYSLLVYLVLQISPTLMPLMLVALYVFVIYALHFAIYSSLRYRFSRTTYREIRFGLAGKPVDFANDAFKNFLLSVITLGIWTPFYMHRKFSYIYNRLHYGNMKFEYVGDEKEFFKIAIVGFLLTLVTFGIYYFWWYPQMYNYYIRHLKIGEGQFRTEIEPGEFFGLLFTNLLLTIFTLGLGFAWVQVRTAKFFIERFELAGDFDLDSVVQKVHEDAGATGEGFADAFDLDIGLGI